MQNLVFAIAIIAGGYFLLRTFARTPASGMALLVRKLGGAALMGLAGLLALRGGINAAIPLFVVGAGLFGISPGFGNNFNWGKRTSGQSSKVETSLLAMELDHDTGKMDGTIKAGNLKGRKLSSLTDGEIKAFYGTCASAGDQSRALLEAWLDRSRSSWREEWQTGQERAQPTSSGAMSRDEALAVLGLRSGAGEDDIRKAHKRLMKEFHPDLGGSDYLAAKINQAKDILLHP